MNPSVQVVEVASLPARRAPISDGPTARVLATGAGGVEAIGATGSPPDGATARGAALLQVSLPAGAGMPEHDHGPSAVTLIPLAGRVQLGHNGDQRVLTEGTVAFIDVGARVSLHNPHTDEATLLVVITPPDFASAVSSWPMSTAPASESETDPASV